MAAVWTLQDGKNRFSAVVDEAETGEVVHISRHGKPVAVLISEQAYASLQGHQSRRGVWTAIADWRAAAHGRHADDWPLDSGPVGTQEIEAWRDRSTGRKVQLGLPAASSNGSTAICRGC